MARCRATHTIPVGGEKAELACDLDDHEDILSFHFDRLMKLEWREPLEPTPVPSTRTNPPKRGVVAKAAP